MDVKKVIASILPIAIAVACRFTPVAPFDEKVDDFMLHEPAKPTAATYGFDSYDGPLYPLFTPTVEPTPVPTLMSTPIIIEELQNKYSCGFLSDIIYFESQYDNDYPGDQFVYGFLDEYLGQIISTVDVDADPKKVIRSIYSIAADDFGYVIDGSSVNGLFAGLASETKVLDCNTMSTLIYGGIDSLELDNYYVTLAPNHMALIYDDGIDFFIFESTSGQVFHDLGLYYDEYDRVHRLFLDDDSFEVRPLVEENKAFSKEHPDVAIAVDIAELGIDYHLKNDISSASACYSEAIRIFRESSIMSDMIFIDCMVNQSWIQYQLEEYHGCIDTAELILATATDQDYLFDAYYVKGLSQSSLERYDDAILDYSKCIEIKNDISDIWFQRGDARLYTEDFIGAESDFTKCLSLDDSDDLAYIGRSLSRYGLQRYEDAINDCNIFIERTGEPIGYIIRSDNYYFLGEKEKALDDLITGYEMDADMPDLLLNITILMVEMEHEGIDIDPYIKRLDSISY